MGAARFPKVVAFDLDYTLWPYWVDTHIDPPLKRKNDALNQVVDRGGQKLSFYPDVPSILLQLRDENVHVAAASRTAAPTVARQALRELLLDEGASASARPPRQVGRAADREHVTKAIRTSFAFTTQTCLTNSKSTRAPRSHISRTLLKRRVSTIAI